MVLNAFGKARLLSFDRDLQTRGPTVEVAHEALLREWPRLREWLNDSGADVRLQRLLANETAEWLKSNREVSFLLRGSRLQQFEDWGKTTSIALTNDERAYLKASLNERERQRLAEEDRHVREEKLEHRARRVLQGLVAVAIIAAIISGTLALIAASREQDAQAQRQEALTQKQESETQRQEAEKQRQEALRQASIGLAAQAIAELDGTAPERSVLLALEALENYPYTGQAENALTTAVEKSLPYFDMESHIPETSLGHGRWSPDGQLFAAASGTTSGTVIVVWDPRTGEPMTSVLRMPTSGPDCYIKKLAWSPDGTQLLAITVRLDLTSANCPHLPPPTVWDIPTGAIARQLDTYVDDASSGDWSADGRWIVIGDITGTVKIWDGKNGELQAALAGQAGAINDIDFSPQSDRIATASADGTAIIWDIASGQVITTLGRHSDSVTDVSWSVDGKRIATSSEDGLGRIFDASTGDMLLSLAGHADIVYGIAWSPTADRIATVSNDGTLRLWDSTTGIEDVRIRTQHTADISWSPSGDQLTAGANGGYATYVRIWRVSAVIKQLIGHEALTDAQWSPDGTRIATEGQDGTMRIWDVATGRVITDPMLRSGGAFLMTNGWSPDGSRIASASYPDFVTVIWDPQTTQIITTAGDGKCFMHYPNWSPVENKFVTGCLFTPEIGDSTPATIWDVNGNRIMDLPSNDGESVRGEWSPDGKRIAVGYADGTAKIWEAETGRELVKMAAANGAWIWHVTWSPDGKRVASADANGVIKVWDAATGTEVMSYQVPKTNFSLDWSPDGKYLISAGVYSIPVIKRVWQSTEELIQYAKECCVSRELTAVERQQYGLAAK